MSRKIKALQAINRHTGRAFLISLAIYLVSVFGYKYFTGEDGVSSLIGNNVAVIGYVCLFFMLSMIISYGIHKWLSKKNNRIEFQNPTK